MPNILTQNSHITEMLERQSRSHIAHQKFIISQYQQATHAKKVNDALMRECVSSLDGRWQRFLDIYTQPFNKECVTSELVKFALATAIRDSCLPVVVLLREYAAQHLDHEAQAELLARVPTESLRGPR